MMKNQYKDHLESNFRLLADTAPVMIWVSDTDKLCYWFNKVWLDFTGRNIEQELGNGWAEGVHPDDLEICISTYNDHFDRRQPFNMEYRLRRDDGEYRWLSDNGVPNFDLDGQFQGYIGSCIDITPLKEYQQKLEKIANYDLLTNLPNRALLSDLMQHAMSQSRRRNQSLAIGYLDLDEFKAINDTHGHSMGDELLIEITLRMKQALRDGDILARIGGDEFVVVLIDIERMADCEPILERLLKAASDPIIIDDNTLNVSVSLGVTLYPDDGANDADQLMRHADQAMYIAKEMGKNRYHLFDVFRDSDIKSRQMEIKDIRRGIEHHEFMLYYQPKVNMQSGDVIGAEALIRWQHPKRGLVTPGDFLPSIENHMLSVELGDWVIDTTLRQIVDWQSAGFNIPVSVNVSAYQIQDQDFVTKLSAALDRQPEAKAHCLSMEIVETSALEMTNEISDIINACKELGVNFALDDFGTGFSSLTYLKHLPVDELKIDLSFVKNILSSEDDQSILKAVISLGTAFHLQVIAEGVEKMTQGTKLLSMGCSRAQGYAIARPMPAEKIPLWIQNWHQDETWKNS